ncbi:MAG: CehA/McbA family metallohydrolase [Planctomycetaceae bacterium]
MTVPYCLAFPIVFLNVTCALATDLVSVQFNVSDLDERPLPCRVHLKNEEGEIQIAVGQPFWNDHFVCSGQVTVSVKPGKYTWEIERGPEYQRASGDFTVTEKSPGMVEVRLLRMTSLREEGWYSGDLHVHRPVDQIERLMRAEDLDFAPVITWWNKPAGNAAPVPQTEFPFDGGRRYTIMAGEDEREGGALLYFGLRQPLDLTVKSREFPSPMRFVTDARRRDSRVWIDIEKPFWRDVPCWLASGKMNSIGLANNHMCRNRMYESEAWGRSRDVARLPNPVGNGYWTQEIYYHILNSGIRIPPSAGSASGVLPNPVGYNRVYVQLGHTELTRDAWFKGLSGGRCFVTNGPLLRVKANGRFPGRVLKLHAGESLKVNLDITLTSSDPVPAVEIIHNGGLIQRIECTEQRKQVLSTTLTLDEPGWLIVRAITDVDSTFRFASTAPWYIESAAMPHRISRASARFFLDWVDERIERIRRDVTDADQLRAVLDPHQNARIFWQNRVRMANADLNTDTVYRIEATSVRRRE